MRANDGSNGTAETNIARLYGSDTSKYRNTSFAREGTRCSPDSTNEVAHGLGQLTSIAAALAALAGCGGSDDGGSVSPPSAGASAPAPSGGALDSSIKLPDGFVATIFADKLDRPRHIAVRDNGDVYVALRSGRAQVAPSSAEGGVVGLRDTNGDGVADVTERFGAATSTRASPFMTAPSIFPRAPPSTR